MQPLQHSSIALCDGHYCQCCRIELQSANWDLQKGDWLLLSSGEKKSVFGVAPEQFESLRICRLLWASPKLQFSYVTQKNLATLTIVNLHCVSLTSVELYDPRQVSIRHTAPPLVTSTLLQHFF